MRPVSKSIEVSDIDIGILPIYEDHKYMHVKLRKKRNNFIISIVVQHKSDVSKSSEHQVRKFIRTSYSINSIFSS